MALMTGRAGWNWATRGILGGGRGNVGTTMPASKAQEETNRLERERLKVSAVTHAMEYTLVRQP